MHHCHWCAPVPWITVVPRGLEPRTLQLLAVRSDQLSYETLDLVSWPWASCDFAPLRVGGRGEQERTGPI